MTVEYGARGASQYPPGTRTAELIRELIAERLRQKLSRRQLLDLIPGGWPMRALQHVEGGFQSPTVEFLLCWAEALGRPLTLGGRP